MFLSPDWYETFPSVNSIEKYLDGFKFKGEGWYITKTDTVLVEKISTTNHFRAYVWNNPKAIDFIKRSFNEKMQLPVHNENS
jgi:glutamine cyclotransferase